MTGPSILLCFAAVAIPSALLGRACKPGTDEVAGALMALGAILTCVGLFIAAFLVAAG